MKMCKWIHRVTKQEKVCGTFYRFLLYQKTLIRLAQFLMGTCVIATITLALALPKFFKQNVFMLLLVFFAALLFHWMVSNDEGE